MKFSASRAHIQDAAMQNSLNNFSVPAAAKSKRFAVKEGHREKEIICPRMDGNSGRRYQRALFFLGRFGHSAPCRIDSDGRVSEAESRLWLLKCLRRLRPKLMPRSMRPDCATGKTAAMAVELQEPVYNESVGRPFFGTICPSGAESNQIGRHT